MYIWHKNTKWSGISVSLAKLQPVWKTLFEYIPKDQTERLDFQIPNNSQYCTESQPWYMYIYGEKESKNEHACLYKIIVRILKRNLLRNKDFQKLTNKSWFSYNKIAKAHFTVYYWFAYINTCNFLFHFILIHAGMLYIYMRIICYIFALLGQTLGIAY